MATNRKKDDFVAIYEAKSDAIFRYCYFRTSDREVAIDIVQETFIRLWTAMEASKEIQNHQAFLYTIARNLIIDFYRKKKTLSLDALAENDENEYYLPKDLSETINIEARHIINKIQELEPQYRQVVYLRFVEELKPQEIAEITGESANVISVRINRGLDKLRKIIGEK